MFFGSLRKEIRGIHREKYRRMSDKDTKAFEDRLTALGESEMQLFRFLLDKPAGAILTAETDKLIAELLERDDLVMMMPGDKVIIPEKIRGTYAEIWNDGLELRWQKRNWMYKCLEAARYLYGVMSKEALRDLYGVRYVNAGTDEVAELFRSTPAHSQWFAERDGKLVLNGYEKDDYFRYLETKIQGDTPYYVPTREEIEELYERGCLLSREAHSKLQEYISEAFRMDPDEAGMKVHELYEAVNNHVRVNDAVESLGLEFPSDEAEVKLIELFMEMSRECRVRDNRGHDSFEMAALMALRSAGGKRKEAPVKRVKVGRNDPCPCGSGKKYKNCCGRPS